MMGKKQAPPLKKVTPPGGNKNRKVSIPKTAMKGYPK